MVLCQHGSWMLNLWMSLFLRQSKVTGHCAIFNKNMQIGSTMCGWELTIRISLRMQLRKHCSWILWMWVVYSNTICKLLLSLWNQARDCLYATLLSANVKCVLGTHTWIEFCTHSRVHSLQLQHSLKHLRRLKLMAYKTSWNNPWLSTAMQLHQFQIIFIQCGMLSASLWRPVVKASKQFPHTLFCKLWSLWQITAVHKGVMAPGSPRHSVMRLQKFEDGSLVALFYRGCESQYDWPPKWVQFHILYSVPHKQSGMRSCRFPSDSAMTSP